MNNSIRIDRNVPVEMRDGTLLRADIYRPVDSAKYPAILIRTPYDKFISWYTDMYNSVEIASNNYAVVVQDTRGRFASDGERIDIMQEGSDGFDSIEWIAAQSWCDGNIGMAGGSYLAHVQWMTAVEKPPHLKAIAPSVGGMAPVMEQNLLGGVAYLNVASYWLPSFGLDIIDRLQRQGKDVSQMRKMIIRALFNQQEVYDFLPLNNTPHFQFEGIREMWQGLIDPIPKLENYKKFPQYLTNDTPSKIRWPYHQVTVPCFQTGGWFDFYTYSIFENFLSMRERGGSQRARDGQHLLIGPWLHGIQPNFTGGMVFGMLASGRATLLSERHVHFFDTYLRGLDRNLAPIRYFVMGRNRWLEAETWPLPQTKWQRFFIHSRGHANTASGDGQLSRNAPTSESPDMFVYDPQSPVPTSGGRNEPFFGLLGGPMDQSRVEQRNDVLCYSTSELEEDMEVTGPLEFHLSASTSAKDTDFTAKLVDVCPDGTSYGIADGIIRARYRKSIFLPVLVNPDEINQYTIYMAATSYLFRKGHRIRIDIASSSFPAHDRNMNTGNPIGVDAIGISATQTIYHQSEYVSYIDLPVIPASPHQGSRIVNQ